MKPPRYPPSNVLPTRSPTQATYTSGTARKRATGANKVEVHADHKDERSQPRRPPAQQVVRTLRKGQFGREASKIWPAMMPKTSSMTWVAPATSREAPAIGCRSASSTIAVVNMPPGRNVISGGMSSSSGAIDLAGADWRQKTRTDTSSEATTGSKTRAMTIGDRGSMKDADEQAEPAQYSRAAGRGVMMRPEADRQDHVTEDAHRWTETRGHDPHVGQPPESFARGDATLARQVDDVIQRADLVQAQVFASHGARQVERRRVAVVCAHEHERRQNADFDIRHPVTSCDSLQCALGGADRITCCAQRMAELRQERDFLYVVRHQITP